MMMHSFPGAQSGHPLLSALVGLSYFLQTVTVIIIIVQGFRHGSYGMPLWGIVSLLGICFICGFIGPAMQPHLFFRLVGFPFLHWLWRGWTVLMAVVFVQYMWWVQTHPGLWPGVRRYILWIALPLLALVTYGEWTFLVFYQDGYINETWALCILVMSINYLTSLFTRVKLRGLSVSVAWLWFVSNAFLYVGIVFGDMTIAYPCHNGRCAIFCSQVDPSVTCLLPEACHDAGCGLQFATSYDFIYLIYAVTLFVNLWYAIGLMRRRHELAADWDPRRTLARIVPDLGDARGPTSGRPDAPG